MGKQRLQTPPRWARFVPVALARMLEYALLALGNLVVGIVLIGVGLLVYGALEGKSGLMEFVGAAVGLLGGGTLLLGTGGAIMSFFSALGGSEEDLNSSTMYSCPHCGAEIGLWHMFEDGHARCPRCRAVLRTSEPNE